MVAIDRFPLFLGGLKILSSAVDEIASFAEATVAFYCESMAGLCFVISVVVHVYTKFLWSVGELALESIGTVTLIHKILA